VRALRGYSASFDMLNCNLLPGSFRSPDLAMERAARVFRKAKQSRSLLTDDQVLSAVWPAAVGKAIAAHTSRIRVVRTILVIEVEDAIWQRQLRTLEKQILDRVRLFTPDLALAGVEVRIGVPRREPQKATAPTSRASEPLFTALSNDEAERIQDPVLKKVYQISRRKASA
jgi:hypothetical protein